LKAQVPLLHNRVAEVGVGLGDSREGLCELEALPLLGSRRRLKWKWIAGVRVGVRDPAGRLCDRHRKSERLVGGEVIQPLLADVRVEDPPAAAKTGLAAAKQIVGEADPRPPIVEPRSQAGAGDAGVAGKNVAARRGRKNGGLLAWPELRNGVLQI